MPFTPFHFGPGAAAHAAAPKHVSFLAFCGANVLIDLEPLYFMLTKQYPLHRFLHTYVGATLVWVGMTALFMLLRTPVVRLLNLLGWKPLTLLQVSIGAALGSYSHIVLDSLMHPDIRPLAPFSDANPFLDLVSLSALHWFCIDAGIVALVALGARRAMDAAK